MCVVFGSRWKLLRIVDEFRIGRAVGRRVDCGEVVRWVTVRCVLPGGGAREALLACWHVLMHIAIMQGA